jgi:hypothetical protein
MLPSSAERKIKNKKSNYSKRKQMKREAENDKKTLPQKQRVHDFTNTLPNVGGTRGMQVNAELCIDVGEAFHASKGNGADHRCATPIVFFLFPSDQKLCVSVRNTFRTKTQP